MRRSISALYLSLQINSKAYYFVPVNSSPSTGDGLINSASEDCKAAMRCSSMSICCDCLSRRCITPFITSNI